MIGWIRQFRRRRLLRREFPAEWEAILLRNSAAYRRLATVERRQLEQLVQIFVAERYWEGCSGLEMTDEIRVTIAGEACRLMLGLNGECYEDLQTVLVYPDTYVAREVTHGPAGIVTENRAPRLGETWSSGPIVLVWSSVLSGARGETLGQNVVLHEFAHFLDLYDGLFDGTPRLDSPELLAGWNVTMTAEYNHLVHATERQEATVLDYYGATNPAEFFAVATECFFERPAELLAERSPLYDLLCRFYRQDPARQV